LLVVDADPAVHDSLNRLLQREGRQILDVYDGAAALECARRIPCDLVVAGQTPNGIDGVQLLRRLGALRPAPRVILCGDHDPASVIAAIGARAFSYFHNPLPQGPLADMAQLALDSASWRDDVKLVSASPEWVALDVRCKLDAAERTTQFVREMEADLPHAACEDVAAAFRELLFNAVEHGGKCDPRKHVRVSLLRTGRALMVHVQDPGQGFSMDLLPHAAINNPDDSPTRHVDLRAEHGQRPGGFGILMARSLVDEIVYNERGNEVMFVRYLK
jgi:anti-sigma regulatory factor (Ser/Thr protein kinase)/ActR/RegA family two-component response regulator